MNLVFTDVDWLMVLLSSCLGFVCCGFIAVFMECCFPHVWALLWFYCSFYGMPLSSCLGFVCCGFIAVFMECCCPHVWALFVVVLLQFYGMPLSSCLGFVCCGFIAVLWNAVVLMFGLCLLWFYCSFYGMLLSSCLGFVCSGFIAVFMESIWHIVLSCFTSTRSFISILQHWTRTRTILFHSKNIEQCNTTTSNDMVINIF